MNQMDGQAMHLEPDLMLPDLLRSEPIAELDRMRFSLAGEAIEKTVWSHLESSQDKATAPNTQSNDEPS